jgi:nucleoside-diphosphate-sugar epimerase
MLSGKVFLITGATGRLGCETAARLENLGAAVLPIVFKGYPQQPRRVKWPACTNPIFIEEASELNNISAPDYVINFHWLVDRSLSYTSQLLFELDWGLHRISFFWEWLKKVSCKRLVNVSSTKVFSQLNDNPISSDTDPRPASPYGLAKLTAERFLDTFFASSKIAVIHARLCSVASYGEHPSHLMTRLFKSCYEEAPIKINTGHSMNIEYIDEAIDLLINAALRSDKSKYLLTTPSIVVDEIAFRFEKISGRKLHAEYTDLNPGTSEPIFNSDIESLRDDWIRFTTFEQIIRKIIQLNLNHGVVTDGFDLKLHASGSESNSKEAEMHKS